MSVGVCVCMWQGGCVGVGVGVGVCVCVCGCVCGCVGGCAIQSFVPKCL